MAFQRTKQNYLEMEESLQALVSNKEFQVHFQAWLDATIADLDVQFESCEQTLGDLQQTVQPEEGDYWNFKTLVQHCNLCIDEKRLIRPGQPSGGEHLTWPEAVILMQTMHSLKIQSYITQDQRDFLAHVEEEMRHVIFDRRELQTISAGLTTKLSTEIEQQTLQTDLDAFQRRIEALTPQLVELENLLESARLNGDMAVAEHMSAKQLDKHEELLALITGQYPIIHRRHSDTEDFKRRRRWQIFRMANKDITCVVEAKMRQIEACGEDMSRIEEQVWKTKNLCGTHTQQPRRRAAP